MLLRVEKWGHKAIQTGIYFGYPFYLIITLFGFTPEKVVETKTIIPIGLIMIALIVFFFLSGTIKSYINRSPAGTLRTVLLCIWGAIPYVAVLAVGIFLKSKVGEIAALADLATEFCLDFLNKMGNVCISLFICYLLGRIWEIFFVTPVEVAIRRKRLKKDLDAIAKED